MFHKELEEMKVHVVGLKNLLSRDNNEQRATVYGKPTHTVRLLEESSYQPTSHKATNMKTLTRLAQLVFDAPDSLLTWGKQTPCRCFSQEQLQRWLIRWNIYRPVSSSVYVLPRKETIAGEERGLLSQAAAGSRTLTAPGDLTIIVSLLYYKECYRSGQNKEYIF